MRRREREREREKMVKHIQRDEEGDKKEDKRGLTGD